jgi:hypothetical protein
MNAMHAERIPQKAEALASIWHLFGSNTAMAQRGCGVVARAGLVRMIRLCQRTRRMIGPGEDGWLDASDALRDDLYLYPNSHQLIVHERFPYNHLSQVYLSPSPVLCFRCNQLISRALTAAPGATESRDT